jgi:hypothetical protein
MTNPGGIMQCCMYYGVETVMKSNVRMYFYKFDIDDLIEVEYKNNLITIYIFQNSTLNAEKIIIDDLEYFAGYFKSAGLEGMRFLFDISNKMPVSYNDFKEYDNLIRISNRKDHAFILDKRDGYITNIGDVFVYVGVLNRKEVDTSILCFVNDWINIIKPKYKIDYKNTEAITALTLISGFLSGINVVDIKAQIGDLVLKDMFLNRILNVDFTSDNVNDKMKNFKTDRFVEIVRSNNPVLDAEIVEKEFNEKEVSLKDIVDMGLDRFMKTIKNPSQAIKVIVDTEWQSIISMYIVKGAAFITPGSVRDIHYFYELLDSDNVNFVMN